MKDGFESSALAKRALGFHCPRWSQLPEIALYMDQVTGYINDIFQPLCAEGQEPLLTKAMVNNYVKLRVIHAPDRKKYSRDHIAYLIAICVLKQVFSIPEIARLIQGQITVCPVENAYDYFCGQLESCLKAAFSGETSPLPEDDKKLLAMRAAQAWADKMFLQKRLEYEYYEQKEKAARLAETASKK